MTKSYVYILFSKKLNRFYTGATHLNENVRLDMHLSSYYGKSKFTAKAQDWELFYSIQCTDFKQALKIEKHIKMMKSKIYMQSLIKYPEITENLLQKYKIEPDHLSGPR